MNAQTIQEPAEALNATVHHLPLQPPAPSQNSSKVLPASPSPSASDPLRKKLRPTTDNNSTDLSSLTEALADPRSGVAPYEDVTVVCDPGGSD